jgi:peptidoglycan/xylan/chitin deacetylase (PgdA/CDA1 family)
MKGLPVGRMVWVVAGTAAVALMLGRHLLPQGPALPPAAATQSVLEGLTGPETPSVVPREERVSPRTYDHGRANRLAVLLTDPDSPWLGLAHGLKAIGIPFRITTDFEEAVRHHVVLVYPMVSGRVLSHDALAALVTVPRRGGTLIAVNVLGGGLNEVFGFLDAVPSRTRFEIRFTKEVAGLIPTLAQDNLIRLGGTAQAREPIGTYGYTNPHAAPLAVYEDGSAAITYRPIARGHAYALGFDPGIYMLRGYNNRAGGADVNRYEAGTDTVLRLLREIYRHGEPHAVTLGTVPSGRALSVLLTHDVDYNKSVENSIAYGTYERSRGIRATYFVQTKYLRDYNDTAFFDDRGVALLKKLAAMGMELASHTVAHSRAFLTFPMGTGEEAFPSYRPFVKDRQSTEGGTVLGELRVSKFLLEKLVTHQTVVSFRPGDLAIPVALPQALVATGYHFSSAATANDAQTHLPFQLTYGRGFSSDTPIFELPITIEDERGPLPLARLDQVIDLARRLSVYGGSFVVLIHPNVVRDKLDFERRLVEAVRDQAWFGSISDYGSWWAARNATEIDVTDAGANPTVHVHAPDLIDGLTLTVPAGWRFSASDPGKVSVKTAEDRVILGPVVGDVALHFQQSSRGPAENFR